MSYYWHHIKFIHLDNWTWLENRTGDVRSLSLLYEQTGYYITPHQMYLYGWLENRTGDVWSFGQHSTSSVVAKVIFKYCNFYCAAEWYTCSWGFQLLLRAVRVPFLWQPAMVARTNIWRKKNATFYGGDDSLDFWSTFQRFSLLVFPTPFLHSLQMPSARLWGPEDVRARVQHAVRWRWRGAKQIWRTPSSV